MVEVEREAERAGPASEAELVQLWRYAAVRVGPMRDSLGRSIEVVYPGRRSGLAGPDLSDAIVSVDGGPTRRMDVEVHLDEASWRRHGHADDARYQGAILHVVWTAATRGSPDLPPHILAPEALAGAWPPGREPANPAEFPCWAAEPRRAGAAERVRESVRAEGVRR